MASEFRPVPDGESIIETEPRQPISIHLHDIDTGDLFKLSGRNCATNGAVYMKVPEFDGYGAVRIDGALGQRGYLIKSNQLGEITPLTVVRKLKVREV